MNDTQEPRALIIEFKGEPEEGHPQIRVRPKISIGMVSGSTTIERMISALGMLRADQSREPVVMILGEHPELVRQLEATSRIVFVESPYILMPSAAEIQSLHVSEPAPLKLPELEMAFKQPKSKSHEPFYEKILPRRRTPRKIGPAKVAPL